MSSPSIHPATTAVVELVTHLCRGGGWILTRDLAELIGGDRTMTRRALRELATREWVLRRERDGAESWRRGPVVEDASRRYMDLVRAEYDRAQARMGILAMPLGPAWRPTPAQRHQVPQLRERSIPSEHHQATAAACVVVELLLEVGLAPGVTAATVAGLTGLHRVTATYILDELVVQGWATRVEGDGPHQYGIGPGLPRLGHQVLTALPSAPMVGGGGAAAERAHSAHGGTGS